MSEAARAAGVSPSTWHDYEGGRSSPTLERLQRIAALLGCSIAYLVGENIEAPPEFPAIPTYETGGGTHWAVAEGLEPYDTPIPAGMIGYRVHGDSMEPVARDGQTVIATPDVDVKGGDLAVVELNDDSHAFKRVYYQDGRIVLQSVNTIYPPKIVKRREVRRIMRVWGVKF